MTNKKTCGKKCDVYCRVCGYYRPVRSFNDGKKQEFKDRKFYDRKDGE